jgi:hypothetical protein
MYNASTAERVNFNTFFNSCMIDDNGNFYHFEVSEEIDN